MAFRLPCLQFSLRTLVIGMVIVAALASWHGARYARYKARLAARTQAAEHGLVFFTQEEAENFHGYKFHDKAGPSLIERWDLFWFGREAGKFPACEMSMSKFMLHPKPYAEKNYRLVFELHPEIELAMASLYGDRRGNSKGFDRVAWYIDHPDKITHHRELMAAANDFARLPELRYFQFGWAALIDDSWVAALPDKCGLIELRGKLAMSPSSLRSLLNKAPQLEEFELDKNLIDQVRDAVDARYYITQDGSFIRLQAKQ